MTLVELEQKVAQQSVAIEWLLVRNKKQKEVFVLVAQIIAALAEERPGNLTELSSLVLDALADMDSSPGPGSLRTPNRGG